jgi:hypothetical protein
VASQRKFTPHRKPSKPSSTKNTSQTGWSGADDDCQMTKVAAWVE